MKHLLEALRRFLSGKDLNLHAAAVTFYGGIGLVPTALITIRLAALLVGVARVRHATTPVIAAVPGALGADRGLAVLVDAGVRLSPVYLFAALVPATLYGEGLRRAFVSLAKPNAPRAGWRGRLLVLPVLAVGPVLLLALLAVLSRAARVLQRGGWSSVGSVIISFLAVWLALSVVIILVYRVIAPVRPGWAATAICGSFTAANISGFAHGFVLFWALPLNLGVPFGGLTTVGEVVAVALWLYLFHLLTLVGYAFTLQVHEQFSHRPAALSAGSDPAVPASQPSL
jgi:membrane protein